MSSDTMWRKIEILKDKIGDCSDFMDKYMTEDKTEGLSKEQEKVLDKAWEDIFMNHIYLTQLIVCRETPDRVIVKPTLEESV